VKPEHCCHVLWQSQTPWPKNRDCQKRTYIYGKRLPDTLLFFKTDYQFYWRSLHFDCVPNEQWLPTQRDSVREKKSCAYDEKRLKQEPCNDRALLQERSDSAGSLHMVGSDRHLESVPGKRDLHKWWIKTTQIRDRFSKNNSYCQEPKHVLNHCVVASVSRIDKNIGLFCRISSLL